MSPPARHPAAWAFPILDVARALGLPVQDRKACCFNGQGHRGGQDRTPSLVFFPDSERYHCFGCDLAGDAIDLVRAVKSLSFQDAVAWLNQLGGEGFRPGTKQPPPAPKPPLPVPANLPVYDRLFDLTSPPQPDSPAGQYLLGRGLDPALAATQGSRELVNKQEVWAALLGEFGRDLLSAAGLISQKGYFLFARHSLLFFYLDGGHPVFIQARDITGTANAKELMPAKVPCPVLFNRDLLRQPYLHIYLCEGCIDTLSALQLGCPAVGLPGVRSFRPEWFSLFDRGQHIRLAFDNDEAGLSGAANLRTQFRLRGFRADVFHPHRGKDLNEFLVLSSQGEVHE